MPIQKKKTTPSARSERQNRAAGKPTGEKRVPRKKGARGTARSKKAVLGKLKIIPLGGIGEVGKNMTVLEYEDDLIIVDAGLGFPEEDMLGIDSVIPDVSYLVEKKDKIRGLLLTHGHEDHIGAIPYLLRSINPPIYGTPLTLGIIRNKLQEFELPVKPDLREVKAGDVVKCGVFETEFIHVNHSIADACCLAIRTPLGTCLHTGDFKLDVSPIEGEVMNLTRLGEIGNEGVLLLMCESTNAERPGFTPSERRVGESLEYVFNTHASKRIVIATFSSNVHRVQQIINISARHGRKVAITGRSMVNIVDAAVELGYMHVPAGVLINVNEIRRYRPSELTLVTTGSQGEPMSALYRMAFNNHSQITLNAMDVVVLSSSAIPGNEKLIGKIVNELSYNHIEVINDNSVPVHVSGHACQEELKLMQALTKPRYFMPIHGEFRHLAANAGLARYMGIPDERIFIPEIGKVLQLTQDGASFAGRVTAGNVLVDGYGVGDVGSVVLRDRKHLSEDGLIVVVATVDAYSRTVVSGPDIISRGFVYVKESENLMDEVRHFVADLLEDCLQGNAEDRVEIKNRIRDELGRYLNSRLNRKPMILPVITNV